MNPYEHLDGLITSAYLNEPDDRVYRALMAQRDVMIQHQDKMRKQVRDGLAPFKFPAYFL